MSPVRTKQLGVSAEDGSGEVAIERDAAVDRVIVTWFCGDQRSFTPDQLAAAIRAVDDISEHPDVWAELTDSNRKTVYANVDSAGMLAANTSAVADARVPWADMRKALKRIAKD